MSEGSNEITKKVDHVRVRRWLVRARRSWVVVLAGIIGAMLATTIDLADKTWKVTDRLGWTRSEQVILAENTDKSKFSDALIRAAWRRLFLAQLYTRRVLDAAALPSVPQHAAQDIDEAWGKYISALADWNGDLMINIVGLERYYDAAKSRDFEGTIQGQFEALDTHLRELRLSNFAQHVRAGDKEINPVDLSEIKIVAKQVLWDIKVQRETLYFFVRCFSEGKPADKKDKTPAHCDLPTFMSETVREDPQLR